MSRQVWTERCRDGRACAGMHGSPSFIPDGAGVCDHCLVAMFGLQEPVALGCACCELDHDSVTQESVLPLVRAMLNGEQVRPKRYFSAVRLIYLDAKGNEIDRPDGRMRFKGTGYVFDSEQDPENREPVATFEGRQGANNYHERARKKAERLNKEEENSGGVIR